MIKYVGIKRDYGWRKADCLEHFPTNKYATVVIDPPWDYGSKIMQNIKGAGYRSELPYKTMTKEEIASLPIASILQDDSWLFCWATQRHLPFSLELISMWGCRYRFTMTWHKPSGVIPFNQPMYNSEFVVVGSVGKPKFISQVAFLTSFNATQRGHSVKPAEFYNTLQRVTPAPRIDLFSRRLIPGFDVWGDEAPTETLECAQFPLFDLEGDYDDKQERD